LKITYRNYNVILCLRICQNSVVSFLLEYNNKDGEKNFKRSGVPWQAWNSLFAGESNGNSWLALYGVSILSLSFFLLKNGTQNKMRMRHVSFISTRTCTSI
jgi:hypothetical protein